MALTCCQPSDFVVNKDSYVSVYSAFISKVRAEHNQFTAGDWETSDIQYRTLSRKFYDRYETQLSTVELERIRQYKTEYRLLKAKSSGKKLKQKLEDVAFDILNEVSS